MANFCAVIMAKEEKAVIDRVVDFYLAAGAASAVVFFDGIPDFTMDSRAGRLNFVTCDDAFWQPITGERPKMYDPRQEGLYQHAIKEAYEEWLFFVDCDEFLISDRPISTFLDEVPTDEDILRIANVEAVWGPGDDRDEPLGAHWFRPSVNSTLKQRALKLIYGDVHRFMGSGLIGHSAGKHFVRAGKSYASTSAHTSRHADGRPGKWAPKLISADVSICHFDAMHFEHWQQKFLFRHKTKATFGRVRSSREEIIDLVGDSADLGEEHLRQLFERLYCLSPMQIAALKPLGLAFRRDIFDA